LTEEDEGCFGIKCKDCPEHVEVKGKILCNKDNRLGLRASKIADFLGDEEK
jgi:hypothetical protein